MSSEGESENIPEVKRLGKCKICEIKNGRYRCPACDIVSCSLDCVKTHKKESKCDGVRSRSKFIAINKFSELDMLSDYRFLESATRCIESMARDKLKKFTRKGEEAMDLPPHLIRLRNACFYRGCRIRFLPPHFDRHRRNTTKLDFRTREISWKVQFVFIHAQQTIIHEKVHERSKLCEILSPYLEEIEGPSTKRQKLVENEEVEDPFAIYKSKGFAQTRLLLKAEGIHKKPRRFYDLDSEKSLAWNLRDKVLVEYPIIYVIFSNHFSYFQNENDSDEEIAETSSPNKNIDRKDRNDHGGDFSNKADAEPFEHFSTVTFGDPPTSGGPPTATADGSGGKVYDKYFDYYFKYYTDKYGGATSVPENGSKVEEESAAQTPAPQESNFIQKSILDKTSDSSKKSSLLLVTYSGSEDDDE